MRVRYEDGPAEVSVEGVADPVRRGEPVEVSDEVGKSKLEQGWVKVTSHHTKKVTADAETKEAE